MTDEDEPRAETLRTMIAELDVPPSVVDIDAAVRTGRRRGRRRTAILTASVAAALTGVVWAAPLGFGGAGAPDPGTTHGVAPDRPVPPPPDVDAREVSCTMAALATPPGHSIVRVQAADKSGKYLVGTAFHDGRQKIRTAIWTDGVPVALDVPGIGSVKEEHATDVNASGLVVGTATTGSLNSAWFAWTYGNGAGRALPTPAGYAITGTVVVNEHGDVAAAASGPGNGAVIVWPANRPDRPRVMPAPARPEVGDIADDGTVVGLVSTQMAGVANSGKPYLWSPNGAGRELQVPPGWDGGALAGVAGDYAVGSLHGSTASRPAEGEQRRVTDRSATSAPADDPRPSVADRWATARWRLSTGAVEAGEPIEATGGAYVDAATRSGWMSLVVAALGEEGSMLAAPDGDLWRLVTTGNATLTGYTIYWMSGDGRTLLGEAALRPGGSVPARWRCTPLR